MSTLELSYWGGRTHRSRIITTRAAAEGSLVETGEDVVGTAAADDEQLALSAAEREKNRQGWQAIIDSQLIEWGRDPTVLDDEGVNSPSKAVIDCACRLGILLRDAEWAAPHRVVASADGGIVFERWSGDLFAQIEICDDGAILFAAFEQGRLVAHGPLFQSAHPSA